MKTIFLTGASGSMGTATLDELMKLDDILVKAMFLKTKKDIKIAKKLQKKYDQKKLVVFFGDIRNKKDCIIGVNDADYVLHCAALIPPTADYNPVLAKKINFGGTKNLVDIICSSPRKKEIKFVYISSVAVYGNRDYHHPWGRVGDPLMPSAYDFYATTKIESERYILEAGLTNFVILRQTGILHFDLLKNNLKDGLIFHSPYNVPIEWITAHDSGVLMSNLCKKDKNNTLDKSFWNNIYNIGGGDTCRVTNYNTYDEGFKIMHASCKDIFLPSWCSTRNFHCMWFYDSDKLNNYLDFRTQSFDDFWKEFAKRHRWLKLARYIPKSFIRTIIKKVFVSRNSPMYWAKMGYDKRITAFFGSVNNFQNLSEKWEDFPLLCEGNTPEGKIDYEKLRNIKEVSNTNLLLSHGYDETKKDIELDIFDMKQAAEFRGGKCLSTEMTKGNLFQKLEWECHEGHKFTATAFTVLKAGHWCPTCCSPAPWHFDELAKHIPFYAQIWFDTHSDAENNTYEEDCYKDLNKVKRTHEHKLNRIFQGKKQQVAMTKTRQ